MSEPIAPSRAEEIPPPPEAQVDDPATDARLLRLAESITPTREQLREIRAKLPPSTIDYDDEGEQPF